MAKKAVTKTAAKAIKTAPKKAVKKAENKTKPTDESIEGFIDTLPDEQKRNDAHKVFDMMKKATRIKPKLWGAAIIGFGDRVYVSPASGRTVDWFTMGFSPRKANLSLYLFGGHEPYSEQLKKLGKYKTGAGCLYINKLSDVDTKVLEAIIVKSAKDGGKSKP
jgi:hypothetical protein